MNRLRSPWWKMPFACSSTKSISSSTIAWRLVGTPEVAPRTTHQMNPRPTKPRRIDTMIESMLSAQKPPPCSSPPSGLMKKLRWCWMYSDGVSSVASAIYSNESVFAHKKRHRKDQQGDNEGCDQRTHDCLAVVHEHEPKQQHGEAELHRLGA